MGRPVAEVLRCILVPVHLRTASLAHKGLRELRPDELATAAVVDLGRWEVAVGDDELGLSVLGLVRQDRPDGPKSSVRDRAPKGSPAHGPLHCCEVEVLDHDLTVGVHQLSRELMDGLAAQIHTALRSNLASLAFARWC
jgi:hypothetical protein